jgi:hypothetical protein
MGSQAVAKSPPQSNLGGDFDFARFLVSADSGNRNPVRIRATAACRLFDAVDH